MKRIIPILCALVMLLAGCVPVLAASEDRPYYPIAVEESFEGGVDDYRIRKVYGDARAEDNAYIRGSVLKDHARASGNAMILDVRGQRI